MRIVAVVQARLGSARFPRKAFMSLGDHRLTLTDEVLSRVARINNLADVLLAVPYCEESDFASETSADLVVSYPDVSESDVLGRFAAVAREYPADAYLRVTGDCPLWAPDIAQHVIDRFVSEGADYASNDTTISGWPDGTDVEVFTRALLERADREAVSAVDREHVTPIMKRLSGVRLTMLRAPERYTDQKWSVDTAEDLERVRAILAQHPKDYSFAETWQAAQRAVKAHT